jgi:hypothetical protein
VASAAAIIRSPALLALAASASLEAATSWDTSAAKADATEKIRVKNAKIRTSARAALGLRGELPLFIIHNPELINAATKTQRIVKPHIQLFTLSDLYTFTGRCPAPHLGVLDP